MHSLQVICRGEPEQKDKVDLESPPFERGSKGDFKSLSISL